MPKNILVTGSTDGIGKQTALELARQGQRVLVHGRDREKAAAAAREISRLSGSSQVEWVAADLACLDEVRGLAREVQERLPRLEVLINNAGIVATRLAHSRDGFELTLAVNHLAPFLLTNLLLELLKASAPARIINVSSMIHASRIDFDNLQAEKRYHPQSAYSLSKLGNVLFTYKLADLLAGSGVTANCLHPGVINTKLFRAAWGGGGASPEEGARTSVYLALAPELDGATGKYFMNMKETSSAPVSYDRAIQDKLWEISARLVGLGPAAGV